ncbi:hypothetical protein N483_15755 [Pseudoalteromonas luteoviolacea NCIMB 1944]|uniref:Periplasmic component of the Tol biopolymer transport system n=2 Tax=Pseudoalteromonas luteoviolacea TaxID=43657 RepID=V4J751_PSEL2|nr:MULTISPECIES: PD40 domain-containing protein [Pseudoalteromonas]ESP91117.1 hypothetical protein PL2TA16_01124 [Pseudoalteromonas luteoviolacea 2ta16]KZN41350.1 hypothetical protein N483_15755 [Pseudoalteromonas luteoviolacea NCIMB 1944]MCG7550173.1 PD40 domain-containing protein [Pseudoalteromonas sp. Of7M-16]
MGSVKPLWAGAMFMAFTMTDFAAAMERDGPMVGPYLGQKQPGSEPKVFAPGSVSAKQRDTNPFFSPDMSEFYFTRKDPDVNKWSLIVFKQIDGHWHESTVGPRIWRPLLAPDGKTMHMGKYVMTRAGAGWSQHRVLDPMFDREDWGIMRLTAAADGTYVLDDYKSGDVLRISSLVNGKRTKPERLGPQINTGKYNAHPFIAPDGSYLIWDGVRETGYGNSDLYISFRDKQGRWGKAINLGDKVNTSAREASASVTPDGKFLFFNRATKDNDSDIFWVDAKVIEDLRPSNS